MDKIFKVHTERILDGGYWSVYEDRKQIADGTYTPSEVLIEEPAVISTRLEQLIYALVWHTIDNDKQL